MSWEGFALLCLYALALFPLLGAAWSRAAPGGPRRRVGIRLGKLVREAASDVLPFSQVGGIVFGARTAIRHGVAGPEAFASTIVDVTSEALAQIAYIALGFAILSAACAPLLVDCRPHQGLRRRGWPSQWLRACCSSSCSATDTV